MVVEWGGKGSENNADLIFLRDFCFIQQFHKIKWKQLDDTNY
jgi:hypothetical protein